MLRHLPPACVTVEANSVAHTQPGPSSGPLRLCVATEAQSWTSEQLPIALYSWLSCESISWCFFIAVYFVFLHLYQKWASDFHMLEGTQLWKKIWIRGKKPNSNKKICSNLRFIFLKNGIETSLVLEFGPWMSPKGYVFKGDGPMVESLGKGPSGSPLTLNTRELILSYFLWPFAVALASSTRHLVISSAI